MLIMLHSQRFTDAFPIDLTEDSVVTIESKASYYRGQKLE